MKLIYDKNNYMPMDLIKTYFKQNKFIMCETVDGKQNYAKEVGRLKGVMHVRTQQGWVEPQKLYLVN